MAKDYGSWSLADLKAELRKRNAKLTGKKAILVQRLQDYDAMFGGLVNDPEHFMDIHADTNMPKICEDDLHRYSLLAERENLSTSKNMYEENFLMTSRCAESGGSHYITALCLSEMRKNVTYNVTIKFKENILVEGQCECAAGMGPYAQCKHVLVLIYGLIDFSINKRIKTRASCTSTLQTFHHPSKMYNGEPVKAEDFHLKMKHGEDLKNFNPLEGTSSDENNIQKYRENLQNLIINFTAQGGKGNMAIAQISKPANKKVVYAEHDYFEETEEIMFLKKLVLDEEKRKDLEISTRDKKIWRRERVKRMQSCKCMDTNKSKLAESLSVMKEIHTESIKHGLKYEKKAIKIFKEKTGLHVQKCDFIIHAEHQYLGCTPDGLIGSEELLEIKCPYTAINKTITGESVAYLYLCEETGEFRLNKKHEYYYQVQGQLLCSGRKTAYFCVYTLSDFYIIKIFKDEEFIQDMLSKLQSFYEDYFKNVVLNRYLYNIK